MQSASKLESITVPFIYSINDSIRKKTTYAYNQSDQPLMNPIFLKHREKVELTQYDGSDLVYPGDKKSARDKKKSEEDEGRGKKTARTTTKQPPRKKAAGNGASTNLNSKSSRDQQEERKEPARRGDTSDRTGNNPTMSVSSNANQGKASTRRDERSSYNSIYTKNDNDRYSPEREDTSGTLATSRTLNRTSPKKFVPFVSGNMKTSDFEVAGDVLGHEFRSQIHAEALESGLTGYVGRTNIGTIAGVLQGDSSRVEDMKKFILQGGQSQYKVQRHLFRNEKAIDKMSLEVFIKFLEIIKRDPKSNILTMSKEELDKLNQAALPQQPSPKHKSSPESSKKKNTRR